MGGLVAFNMFAARRRAGVAAGAAVAGFPAGSSSIARLGDMLNHASRASGRRAQRLPAIKGGVASSTSFPLPRRRPWRFDGVSFKIEAGEVDRHRRLVGLRQSTLTKLVQRLYIPESGRVLVDEVDLAHGRSTWLRRQIGVVLQENMLFNRSVRENIALAHPAMPLERVIHAAQLAGAHEFILKQPHGYDTPSSSAASISRAGSASASPSRAHWSPIRAC